MGRKPIEALGKRYGRLIVIDEAGYAQGKRNVLCRCDCGVECVVRFASLQKSETLSCGCLRSERAMERRLIHGGSRTKIYGIYRAMLNHCYKETNRNYRFYGGKGIEVCEEWRKDFLTFRKWAYENGYREDNGMRIVREDKEKGYCPENCYIAKTVTIRVQKQDNR